MYGPQTTTKKSTEWTAPIGLPKEENIKQSGLRPTVLCDRPFDSYYSFSVSCWDISIWNDLYLRTKNLSVCPMKFFDWSWWSNILSYSSLRCCSSGMILSLSSVVLNPSIILSGCSLNHF
jgi:hypothetical protein